MFPIKFDWLHRGSTYIFYIASVPGGALGYLGGCIRSLSKLKNTPKALISGQKSTLF